MWWSLIQPAFTSFVISAVMTWLVRGQARRRGWMVVPRPDRWHQEPTALFGGVGIFTAFALALLGGFYRYQDHRYRAFKPPKPPR